MADAKADPQHVLTDEILADARRQAERAIARARRDAKDIVEKARQEAGKDREQRLATSGAEAERRRGLVLATVPVEVGRLRAARVEAVLQSICDAAREQLTRGDGPDYREAVAAMAAEALARMEGTRFVLELAEADRAAFGEGFAQDVARRAGRQGLEVTVASAADRVAAGVVIRDAEGRQVWDNRFEARLKRFWPMLRREIGARTALAADGPRKES